MSQIKSKWITFGSKTVIRRNSLQAVILEDDQLQFYLNDYGSDWIRKSDVSDDEWEKIKNDFYEYKGEIKYD